jgi:hypothetical protein
VDGDYLDIVQFTHTSSFPSLMPREAPECRHPTGVTLRLTLVAVASFICGVTRIMLSPGLSIPYINNLHTILHSRSISLVSIIIQKILQIWLPKDLKSHLLIHLPSHPSDPTMSARIPSRNTSNLAPIPKNLRIVTFS